MQGLHQKTQTCPIDIFHLTLSIANLSARVGTNSAIQIHTQDRKGQQIPAACVPTTVKPGSWSPKFDQPEARATLSDPVDNASLKDEPPISSSLTAG